MTTEHDIDLPDRANLSNRHPEGGEQGSHRPTKTQERPNLSTEHQEPGDARRPSDQLDRGQSTAEESDDKTSLTKNA
ncbi:MAG: hypothetical protein JWL96_1476 [Sphingomonas bacterium]|uniref:hypothetical protein n=1 Tax=Sphingomonas bacterium TaxID=1895847 RepID=UPI002602334B|nr:hypothetical protein [Sphingomonas bacterium]MDB5709406.1 hypothetical protein [Sphingomonas bacterium]